MAIEHETALRILDAAAQEFAEHGLRSARVVEIAQRAGINVSAINYHFGSKQGLYYATLRHQADLALKHHPIDLSALHSASPEQAFRLMIRALLGRFMDASAPSLVGRLLARELTNPTPALDRMIQEVSRPQLGMVKQIVGMVMSRDPADPLVARCSLSVIGQCLFYLVGRPLVERVHPELLAGDDHLDRLAEHIASFSLAAFRQLPQTSPANTP